MNPPTTDDLAGLQRAYEIVEQLLRTRAPHGKAWSFDEGWRLGIEEVRHALDIDIFTAGLRRRKD
jgi:hypothetical protein